MKHGDVFKEFIRSCLGKERKEWDNYSVNPEYSKEVLNGTEAHTSFELCREACESKAECLQFSYISSKCSVSNEVRLGRKATLQCLEYSTAASKCARVNRSPKDMGGGAAVVSSGWMVERLAKYISTMDKTCNDRMG